jgi:hypothetical protein
MTPAQIEEASGLLSDLEENTTKRDRMAAAKLLRLSYCTEPSTERHLNHFIDVGDFKPTAALRKLMLEPIETEIASIKARLIALGVDMTPAASPSTSGREAV